MSITDEHPNVRHFKAALPILMYLTWRNFKLIVCSAALRVTTNAFLSAELNTFFNLPIITTPMRICKDMSEHFHLDITEKSAMTNFFHKW